MKNLTNKVFFIIIILLTANNANNVIAGDRNLELDKLFEQLQTKETETALKIEKKIWKIWSTHPSKGRKGYRLSEMLAKGELMIVKKNLNEAIQIFSLIISVDPNWAEAWNKRATALYLSGKYEDSINDIKKVLQLEPRHFGAISGLGMNQIELRNYRQALKSYKKALKIYPTMQSAKKMVSFLNSLIKGQAT